MTDFETEILQTFLDEATESLGSWERSCLSLDTDGNSTANTDAIAQLFRCAHNMKGSAKSVGLAALGSFIHVVEDLILKLKNGTSEVTPSVVGALLECEAFLRTWLEGLRSDRSLILDGSEPLAQIRAVDASTETPSFEDAQEGDIIFVQDLQRPKVASAAIPPQTPSSQPVLAPATPATPASSPKTSNETIRVPATRIDELIQLVGELSIQASIVAHARNNGTLTSAVSVDAIGLLTKLTRELQSRSLGFRMQTVQTTMQRLERVARDVARELSKNVQVEIEGGDVELDKSVLERMTNPLVHMVRNALDHGVETSSEREASGKPLCARITFSARQEPDSVAIVITDDGRGLDPVRIRAKAEKQGLVSPTAVLKESEIFALIFLQGFSTAETVTNISGRGVGMEVVHKAVTELGGHVAIESTLGQGTSFVISLPSSVSVVDALVVHIDGQRYAVPLGQVEEVLSPRDVQVETASERQSMFRLREDIVPLYDLRSSLEIDPTRRAGARGSIPPVGTILIARHQGRRLGLSVDGISGQQQVVVRQLSGALEGLAGFLGGTILGDGEPGFIIDIPFWAKKSINDRTGAT